jgi:hypothetical protein
VPNSCHSFIAHAPRNLLTIPEVGHTEFSDVNNKKLPLLPTPKTTESVHTSSLNQRNSTSDLAIYRSPRTEGVFRPELRTRSALITATAWTRKQTSRERKVRTPQGCMADNVRDEWFKPFGRPVQRAVCKTEWPRGPQTRSRGPSIFFLEIWRRYPENQTAVAASCRSKGHRERSSSIKICDSGLIRKSGSDPLNTSLTQCNTALVSASSEGPISLGGVYICRDIMLYLSR